MDCNGVGNPLGEKLEINIDKHRAVKHNKIWSGLLPLSQNLKIIYYGQ